jgi:hypothetical protein
VRIELLQQPLEALLQTAHAHGSLSGSRAAKQFDQQGDARAVAIFDIAGVDDQRRAGMGGQGGEGGVPDGGHRVYVQPSAQP